MRQMRRSLPETCIELLTLNVADIGRRDSFQADFPPILNMSECHIKAGGEDKMCTVGGGPDIGNIETLAAGDYECLECKNKFKGMGRRPMCPTCKSRNVKAV